MADSTSDTGDTNRDPPPLDPTDSQPDSKPPTNSPAPIFLAGFGLGLLVGILIGGAVCNKGGRELAAGAGSPVGAVVQASADSGTAAPPPRENAPAEKPLPQ